MTSGSIREGMKRDIIISITTKNCMDFMKVLGKGARKTVLKESLRIGGTKYAQKIKEELKHIDVYCI